MNVGGVGAQPCTTSGNCQTGTANENSILFQGDGTNRKGWLTGTTEGGVSAYAQNTAGTINRIFTAATTGLTIHSALNGTNATFTGNVEIGGGLNVEGNVSVDGNINTSGNITADRVMDRSLPKPCNSIGTSNNAIPSTGAYVNLNPRVICNVTATAPMWVRVDYQARIVSNGATVHFGANITGATTIGINDPYNGVVQYQANTSNNNAYSATGTKTVLLQPGTNVIELQGHKSAAGTSVSIQYPVLTTTPLYWN